MKYSINLLGQKETPFFEKVVYFSLNYLRYIIVITQLVVIGVFFYRFQIDQRIIDLKESVDQKKEIIQVVLPLLKEAETFNKKAVESERIINEQKKFHSMFQYWLSQFPATIFLTNLEISLDSLKATGYALNPKDLQLFYQVLKNENRFSDIELQNLKKTEEGYSFILNLKNFKEK